MQDKINVRECRPEDESAFVKLNLCFMKEVITENSYWMSLKIPTEEEMRSVFREALSMPDNIMIHVGEVNGEVVGYANTWTVYSIWSRGKALTVDDLYIDPSYRRRGIGEKIMEYLIGFAKQNGYKRLQLHAESDNEKAHSLYNKLGFSNETMKFFMKKINSCGEL